MDNETQDIEERGWRDGSVRLAGAERGTRIRLSAELLRRIDWREFEDGPACWGVFRRPGELLCAPKNLVGDDGCHPFEQILELVALEPQKPGPSWTSIPTARIITAPDRVIEFPTAWTSNRQQLTMKIGRKVTRRLGWSQKKSSPIYATNWARILILMSQSRYDAVQMSELLPTRRTALEF